MSYPRTMAGIAAFIFSAAAQAAGDGLPETVTPAPALSTTPSLIVSRETRALMGSAIIDFAEHNIVNQAGLPVVSSADCGTNESVAPSFMAQFSHRVLTAKKVCEAFAEANWRSSGGRYEFSNKNNDENILFMVDMAKTLPDVVKIMGLSTMPLDLPGTAKDWNTFFFFHELQHSRDHTNGTRVAETTEYYADLGGREYYRQAYALGIVSDPGVPDAIRGLRIIDDITNSRDEDTHNIAVLAGLPGITLNATITPARVSASFNAVRKAIYAGIGMSNPVEADKAARDNPHLLYASARRLLLQGVFDHDPVQKAYAGEFIRAAETYGANYYKTNLPEPSPAQQPAAEPVGAVPYSLAGQKSACCRF